ncbi:unnamed protein product [Tilletia controversa]|nr:unnamed protein product [Tilletia controversa]
MISLPTPSTSGDDHDPKAFKRDRESDDITAADNAIQNVPGQGERRRATTDMGVRLQFNCQRVFTTD